MTPQEEALELLEKTTAEFLQGCTLCETKNKIVKQVLAKLREKPEPTEKFTISNICPCCGYTNITTREVCNAGLAISQQKEIKELQAKLKAKDELLFAYEYVRAPKQSEPTEFTKTVRSNVQNWKSVLVKITDVRILSIIGWIPQLCDIIDQQTAMEIVHCDQIESQAKQIEEQRIEIDKLCEGQQAKKETGS